MPDQPRPTPVPPPLTVAASLVAVQGMVLVLLAGAELSDVSPERRSLGLATAAFFGLYGVALLAAAWALWRRYPWSRGPALMTQLIALGLAWSLRDLWAVAAAVAVSAVVVLAGMLHPDSVAALSRDPSPGA